MRILILLLPLLLIACTDSSDDSGAADSGQGRASWPASSERPETLLHLEGTYGEPDSVMVEVGYKIKKKDGIVTKEFEVELENAEPGSIYSITLDRVLLGVLIIDGEGEGEIELGDDAEPFPETFPEPKEGSVVQIGDSIRVTLKLITAAPGR